MLGIWKVNLYITSFCAKVNVILITRKEESVKKNKWISLMILAAMLLVALACEVSFGGGDSEDTSIQQTLQVLQQTQTAAAAGAQQPQPEEQQPAAPQEVEEGPTPHTDYRSG